MSFTLRYWEVAKLLVCVFVVGLTRKMVNYWLSRRQLEDLASKLPGPKALPIFGDALAFSANIRENFNVVLERIDLYGTPCRIWMGNKLFVVVTDPEDVAAVLGNPNVLSRDGCMCKIAEPLMGQGLITSGGNTWRTHRKICAPTLGAMAVERFLGEFNKKSKTLVERVRRLSCGSTVDIFPVVASSVLDMICATTMGSEMSLQHANATYIENIERAIEIVQERFVKPWLHFDWIYRFSKLYRDECETLKMLNRFTDALIGERVNLRSRNGKKSVLLDLLISASENEGVVFSTKELRDEVNTLIAAGYETSSTGICYALMLLGMYPKTQEKVIEEQRSIFGDDFHRQVTAADLKEMHYLDRVIKETLRMFPPAPVIHREIEEEVKLSNLRLVPGCSVLIVNYKTHRLAQHFSQPDLFDPDRFLADKCKDRHPYAYIPFGSGLRNCIGRRYAMMQLKCVLSTFLRHFRVSSRLCWQDLKNVQCGIVLKPSTGFQMELLPREGV